MRIKFIVVILLFLVSIALNGLCIEEVISNPERGKYIYDERNCLPVESQLTLSAYLWQIDSKTGYEMIVIFPKEKMDEEACISWFNSHGVGKKEKDNGTAIFVFPDNSVFVAIGSGNDKISVTYSKTYGEKILKDLDKDMVLSLLRFVNTLSQKLDQSTTIERAVKFGQKVAENLDVIILWALFISLCVFLFNQRNGFQKEDLIIPAGLLIVLAIFVGISTISKSEMFDTTKEYGIITSTKLSEHHWVQVITVSTGKTTTTITIPHTDYINDVTIKSYNLKTYSWRFSTTDSKSAWKRQIREIEVLKIGIINGNLRNAYPVDDNSGGKTIGDGVWLNRK